MEVLTVPSELKSIKEVSDKIVAVLQTKNIDKDIIFDIRLSLEEAVRNAIVHGNKTNKDLKTRVSYQLDSDKLSLIVEDQGSGFKPESLPDPTLEENLTREKGRGVYLMIHLMDEVKYSERGNSVTMTKRLK